MSHDHSSFKEQQTEWSVKRNLLPFIIAYLYSDEYVRPEHPKANVEERDKVKAYRVEGRRIFMPYIFYPSILFKIEYFYNLKLKEWQYFSEQRKDWCVRDSSYLFFSSYQIIEANIFISKMLICEKNQFL